MSRFIREEVEVKHLVLADCRENVPEEYPPDKIIDECMKADKILGIQETVIKHFKVRHLPQERQAVLQTIWDELHEGKYDAVFSPWVRDRHQDHATIATEVLRATKGTPIPVLQYELPANCLGFEPNYFIELTPADIELKMRALEQFQTQSVKRKLYFRKQYWLAQLTIRGGQVGVEYAEGFIMEKGVRRV